MESFEELAVQYEPMIHKIIRSLHIYKNKEAFYQTGLIGLWEATLGFDTQKGTFTNYAYAMIKGKILTEMKDCTKDEERNDYPDEAFWGRVAETKGSEPFFAEGILSYCHDLTEKETIWVLATFLEDLSVKEIALREHVTASAVRQWKTSALKKLRAQQE